MAAVVAAVAVTACGSANPQDQTGGRSPSTDSSRPRTPPSAVKATQVTVVRSGGMSGRTVQFKLTAESPQSGRAMKTALQLRRVAQPDHVVATPPCCDIFVFAVTIAYSDGSTANFRSFQGDHTTPGLQDLISQVVTVGKPVTAS
ncbi:MAG: hypothetical protein ACRDP1_09525 [Nocardioidaceae bacterium]